MPLDVQAMLSDPLFQMGVNTIGQPGGFTNAIRQGVKGGISGLQQMQQLTASRRAQQAADQETQWRMKNIPEGMDPSLTAMWARGQLTTNELYTQDRMMKAAAAKTAGAGAGAGGVGGASSIWGTGQANKMALAGFTTYLDDLDKDMSDEDIAKGANIARSYAERGYSNPNSKTYGDPVASQNEAYKYVLSKSTNDETWMGKLLSGWGMGDEDIVLPIAPGPESGNPPAPPVPPMAPGNANVPGVAPQSTVDSMALQGVGVPGTMSQSEAAAQAQDYMTNPMQVQQQVPEAIQQLGAMQEPGPIESLSQPSPAITPEGNMYKDSFINKGANYALEALGNAIFGKKAEGAEADGRSYNIKGLPDNAQYNFTPAEGMIAEFEGYSETAYKDAGGYSKGFGQYGAKEGETANVEDSVEFLKGRVKEIEGKLDKQVPSLPESVRTAVTSLIYNIGWPQWAGSNAATALKAGDIGTFLYEAFDPEVGFVKSEGEINSVLVERRQLEKALAMQGMDKGPDTDEMGALLAQLKQANQYGRNEVF